MQRTSSLPHWPGALTAIALPPLLADACGGASLHGSVISS